MNQIYLLGHSGAKAELRYLQNQVPICQISLATSEKKSDGTYESTWHQVVFFNKMAEEMAPRIQKGSEILVIGKLQTNEWTNKEGKKRKLVRILAQRIKIIEKQQTPEAVHKDFLETTKMTEQDIPF